MDKFDWTKSPPDEENRIMWDIIRNEDDSLYEGEWVNN